MSGRSLAYLSEIPVERVKGLTGSRGKSLGAQGKPGRHGLVAAPPARQL